MLQQNRMKALTVTGSVLALAAGTLAGMAPAQAASSGPDSSAPAATSPTWKAPETDHDSAWYQAKGSAPIPWNGSTTGGPRGALTQEAPGADIFDVKADTKNQGRIAAPDGVYEVKFGDGAKGFRKELSVRSGKLDVGRELANPTVLDPGQYIVQVTGPLNIDKSTSADQPYEDEFGNASKEPLLTHSALYTKKDSLLVDQSIDLLNGHGLPTMHEGQDRLALKTQKDTPAFAMGESGVHADLQYRNADDDRVVTMKDLDLKVVDPAAPGGLALTGSDLGKLPSGRYSVSFSLDGKDEGPKERVFFMVNRDKNDGKGLAAPITYADPYSSQQG